MMKTIAKLLYKACPRCHGDLILDEYEPNEHVGITYECLQCGRTTRVDARAEAQVDRRQPIAA